MKKDFQLPEEDVIFLDGLGLSWEAINDHNMQWIIVHDYPVISGYNNEKVSIAVKIETGYPRTQLDMAYFYPALQRLDGKTINAICDQIIDGKQFQRWSRHRTPTNPWREGVDDLSTHMALISFWFEQEYIKQANGITA
ncbi:MAG: E2/UBC family protein [Bacteroidales bacterium]|nr:E2/UBC family protein [Bacteroidales bacterium]